MAFINGKEILFSSSITLSDHQKELTDIKRAILAKGGDIAESAGFQHVAPAIYDLPVGDPSLLAVEDDDVKSEKVILPGAFPYTTIDKIGGLTRASKNLFDIGNPTIKSTSQWDYNTRPLKIEKGTIYSAGIVGDSSGQGLLLDVRGLSKIYVSMDASFDANTETSRTFSARSVQSVSGDVVSVINTEYFTINEKTKFNIDTTDVEYLLLQFVSNTQHGIAITNLMVSTEDVPYEPYWDSFESAPVTEVVSEGENLCKPEYDRGLASGTRSCVGIMKVKKNTDYFITASSYDTRPYFAIFGVPKSNYKENPTPTEIFSAVSSLGATSLVGDAYEFNSGEFEYICFRVWKPNADYGLPSDVKFCVSTIDEFKPYFCETFQIPSAVQSLPLYGIGLPTIWNEVDFERGKYTQNVHMEALMIPHPDWNWKRNGSYFQATFDEFGIPNASVERSSESLLTGYTYEVGGARDKTWWIDQDGKGICIRDDSYETEEGFTEHIDSDCDILYPIAEPVTIDIPNYFSVIKIESSGRVLFVNDANWDVPNTIFYMRRVE